MSPVLAREPENEPYKLAEYLQTAKSSPRKAVQEIGGAVLIMAVLVGLCLIMGVL